MAESATSKSNHDACVPASSRSSVMSASPIKSRPCLGSPGSSARSPVRGIVVFLFLLSAIWPTGAQKPTNPSTRASRADTRPPGKGGKSPTTKLNDQIVADTVTRSPKSTATQSNGQIVADTVTRSPKSTANRSKGQIVADTVTRSPKTTKGNGATVGAGPVTGASAPVPAPRQKPGEVCVNPLTAGKIKSSCGVNINPDSGPSELDLFIGAFFPMHRNYDSASLTCPRGNLSDWDAILHMQVSTFCRNDYSTSDIDFP